MTHGKATGDLGMLAIPCRYGDARTARRRGIDRRTDVLKLKSEQKAVWGDRGEGGTYSCKELRVLAGGAHGGLAISCPLAVLSRDACAQL